MTIAGVDAVASSVISNSLRVVAGGCRYYAPGALLVVRVKSLLSAPRSLNAPVRCWLSSLRKMESLVMAENVSEWVHGDTRMSDRILPSAAWMSQSWIIERAASYAPLHLSLCRSRTVRITMRFVARWKLRKPQDAARALSDRRRRKRRLCGLRRSPRPRAIGLGACRRQQKLPGPTTCSCRRWRHCRGCRAATPSCSIIPLRTGPRKPMASSTRSASMVNSVPATARTSAADRRERREAV